MLPPAIFYEPILADGDDDTSGHDDEKEKKCKGPDCQSTKHDTQPDTEPLMTTHLPVSEPDQDKPVVSTRDTEDENAWIPGGPSPFFDIEVMCAVDPAFCECPDGMLCPDSTAAEISPRDEIEHGGQESKDENENGTDLIPLWAGCAEDPGLCVNPHPPPPLSGRPVCSTGPLDLCTDDTYDQLVDDLFDKIFSRDEIEQEVPESAPPQAEIDPEDLIPLTHGPVFTNMCPGPLCRDESAAEKQEQEEEEEEPAPAPPFCLASMCPGGLIVPPELIPAFEDA
jgi:hypothetical protein